MGGEESERGLESNGSIKAWWVYTKYGDTTCWTYQLNIEWIKQTKVIDRQLLVAT